MVVQRRVTTPIPTLPSGNKLDDIPDRIRDRQAIPGRVAGVAIGMRKSQRVRPFMGQMSGQFAVDHVVQGGFVSGSDAIVVRLSDGAARGVGAQEQLKVHVRVGALLPVALHQDVDNLLVGELLQLNRSHLYRSEAFIGGELKGREVEDGLFKGIPVDEGFDDQKGPVQFIEVGARIAGDAF